MAKALGIDLGTTNSAMAVLEGGEPTIVENAEGTRTTPSVVAFSKTGEILVGEVAKRQAITNPERTISSVKRDMGSDKNIKIDDKEYTPQEISAKILQKLKRDAEAKFGEKIDRAVITVPAYFDDSQRHATKDAGKIAGLEVLRIINEPTAAALAYGLDKENDQTILVYDLGGGTFDVSVLEIGEGVFEVKSTEGNNHLGGDDFDQRVTDWMADDFKAKNGIDLRKDKMALQRLKEAAEKAKIELSSTLSTTINLPFITADQNGPKHLEMTLSRSELEKLTNDLIEKTRIPVESAMKEAGVSKGELDHIILVGGTTRMPAVQELVKSLTGKEPNKGVNPDEVVAIGAAIQAGVLIGEVKDILLLDVTPLTLGIETKGGIFTKLIEKNTTIPTKKSETFTTADDSQTSVDIHVLQGEREMSAANKTLGKFQLVGIPPAPRGVPQIEVGFDIDADGIVNVSAKDKGTGQEQSITITASSALSQDEIDKMVKEAEEHAAEDHRRHEEAEARNNADNLVYQTEKSLGDLGEKIPEEDKAGIEEKITEAKEALKGDDIDKIKSITEELRKASNKISEIVYQQQSAEQEAAAGQGGEGEQQAKEEPDDEGEVIDAEIVDDDKQSSS